MLSTLVLFSLVVEWIEQKSRVSDDGINFWFNWKVDCSREYDAVAEFASDKSGHQESQNDLKLRLFSSGYFILQNLAYTHVRNAAKKRIVVLFNSSKMNNMTRLINDSFSHPDLLTKSSAKPSVLVG